MFIVYLLAIVLDGQLQIMCWMLREFYALRSPGRYLRKLSDPLISTKVSR
jgi:hypothetical protein